MTITNIGIAPNDNDIMTDRLDLASPDLVNDNFEKLAALFPNCVTESAEGKAIDFDLLKQELSHAVVEGNKERYRLEWPGKKEAIVTANLPTTKTLRPVREDSVDFDNTENLYIEGDNLEVLKLLQESYLGKIKMIYIDPPYNTGTDFIYKDNFTQDIEEYKIESGQKDFYNNRLFLNPETTGRYHSDWLSMIYPRLKLARNLLSDDGVIFISIDDNELHNLGKVCNEIFNENNLVSIISRVTKKGSSNGNFFSPSIDYILCYCKQKSKLKTFKAPISQEYLDKYKLKDSRGLYVEKGLYQASLTLERSANARYYIECPDGSKCIPPANKRWRVVKESFLEMISNNEIVFKKVKNGPLLDENNNQSNWNIYTKQYLDKILEKGFVPPNYLWDTINSLSTKELSEISIPFNFAKPTVLISYLINIIQLSGNEIVLDFFSGSATTAHAVMKVNANDEGKRRFIMVQLPEFTDEKSEAYKDGYKTISDLGKERIRRAAKQIEKDTVARIDYGFRAYCLADSNMQDIYYKPQQYNQATLDLFADNVKPDRTADDLLAQVMLDWGLPLSLKIEQIEINKKKVFKVAGNSLYACFDKNIDEDFAKAIAKDSPLRIVFRDSSFKNDTAKTNVKQLLKQLSPETEMKVI